MYLEKAKIIHISSHQDSRGVLSAIEENKDIPFAIKRIFYIYNIKDNRGKHALKDTDELLIPMAGSFTVRLNDKNSSKDFLLNDPSHALYVPRLIFLELFNFSKDAVCLVLASEPHDLSQYLHTHEDYVSYLDKYKP
ncbi:MAG: TDP-4-oxo-6-deoxy-alpha-D-glucose-3,4-oxoisomerase [Bacteroidetes bacterium ADurb.Bin408]|nr:MAG: TDP-4-oxo-6-deoxy-alpha-D-glucose-3,4-oxoisomerase [Bacteroidetes bacterium ADurb.Bin408]